mmetsp:Transcript_16754/g.40392  ORF Transcript_16754/g.40392 Transcript_16754/m.40392 type:complete len:95 (+) Transcript_16754:438-722(+)
MGIGDCFNVLLELASPGSRLPPDPRAATGAAFAALGVFVPFLAPLPSDSDAPVLEGNCAGFSTFLGEAAGAVFAGGLDLAPADEAALAAVAFGC